MFELLSVVIFAWLMMKVIGLMFRLTWGMAKIIACILIGIALLVPIAMIGIAGGIIKACV